MLGPVVRHRCLFLRLSRTLILHCGLFLASWRSSPCPRCLLGDVICAIAGALALFWQAPLGSFRHNPRFSAFVLFFGFLRLMLMDLWRATSVGRRQLLLSGRLGPRASETRILASDLLPLSYSRVAQPCLAYARARAPGSWGAGL